MNVIHLHTPISSDDMMQLKAGTLISISGTVFTARDKAHKKISELLLSKQVLPVDFTNAALFYAGPSPAPHGMAIGAVGPTTSSRMDAYTDMMLSLGVKLIIGKGSRSSHVQKLLIKYKALYCSGFGGAAAFLNKTVTDAQIVAFEELGPEAVYKLTVEHLPAVVINDVHGGDWYASVSKQG